MNATPHSAPIEPGSVWVIPKGGPWGGIDAAVTVRETAAGWVRFDREYTKDERLQEDLFRRIYVPARELEANAGARAADDTHCSVCGARGFTGLCPGCEAQ